MKRGMANSSAFIVCLSPLYLMRPNCLRELMWAMDMCASAESAKRLFVVPLHPAISFKGCKRIIEAAHHSLPAHVFLPINDQAKELGNGLDQWKGHRLSKQAIDVLERLTGPNAVSIRAGWLKLRPWLIDTLAQDWEEKSDVGGTGRRDTGRLAGTILARYDQVHVPIAEIHWFHICQFRR
jgi:hypothetical protein